MADKMADLEHSVTDAPELDVRVPSSDATTDPATAAAEPEQRIPDSPSDVLKSKLKEAGKALDSVGRSLSGFFAPKEKKAEMKCSPVKGSPQLAATSPPPSAKMSRLIIPFCSCGIEDISRVGGKNASLGEMLRELNKVISSVPAADETWPPTHPQHSSTPRAPSLLPKREQAPPAAAAKRDVT